MFLEILSHLVWGQDRKKKVYKSVYLKRMDLGRIQPVGKRQFEKWKMKQGSLKVKLKRLL